MTRNCANSSCPNRTDSGLCQTCRVEKNWSDSRDYDADGTHTDGVSLRDTETTDENSHAQATAETLAMADDETLAEIDNADDDEDDELRCDGGYYCDECEDSGVVPPGDFEDGDDCPNCDGDPLNALPHKGRPHPPDYDCPDCGDDSNDGIDDAQQRLVTDGGTVTDRNGIECPPSVDGVDLLAADECPVCASMGTFFEHPAGYYHCDTCYSTWAGDACDASIVDYVKWTEGDDPEIRCDGGTRQADRLAGWNPRADSRSGPHCRNCDSQVLPRTVKVFGSNDGVLWHCRECLTLRDLAQGAGTTPDYDPERDRGDTSDNFPIFPGTGDDS